MATNRHVILNYVDTPLRFLLWTVHEIVMLVVPCFIGIIIDHFVLGVTVSVIYFWGYKKYKRRFGKGQFQAVRYWYFPLERRFKAIPPSFRREYIG
jgi:type IV conjugative transfer system protein TraL